ncbi:formyltransferase family protein [Streptomyces bambusae]|uniref:phosphoribosylglycinamide formyltransferase 1 n=1 Tax=Streptomyces bambusae TaxID=1550616 RepID=A0ABS6ZGM9_9ACTN|nr:formyltransferase family protein [Streptomyces bambusae]MBW5486594.1 hypothetical protein [Streptomyces bambusae]
MIFVGDGALLRRAVVHAAAGGYPIDLVCSADPADAAGTAPHLFVATGPGTGSGSGPGFGSAPGASRSAGDGSGAGINAHADTLAAASTDGIVWSVNNRRIFRQPLLSRDLRLYNIHNGLLPQHRGLPSVAVLYALLRGETEYGATLHEVDAGIDTGRVLAERRFPVGPEDRYHEVMLRGIRACQALFEEHLPAVAAGRPAPAPAPDRAAGPPAYYGLRALAGLPGQVGHPAYARATDLGPFAAHAPEVAEAVRHLAA